MRSSGPSPSSQPREQPVGQGLGVLLGAAVDDAARPRLRRVSLSAGKAGSASRSASRSAAARRNWRAWRPATRACGGRRRSRRAWPAGPSASRCARFRRCVREPSSSRRGPSAASPSLPGRVSAKPSLQANARAWWLSPPHGHVPEGDAGGRAVVGDGGLRRRHPRRRCSGSRQHDRSRQGAQQSHFPSLAPAGPRMPVTTLPGPASAATMPLTSSGDALATRCGQRANSS